MAIQCFAEYRAYQYQVVDPYHPSSIPMILTSSLNPVAFRSYHGQSLDTTLLRTWMCYGHTSRQKICPYPIAALPEVQPGETP